MTLDEAAGARDRFLIALRARAPEFGVELSAPAIKLMARYYETLLKWNPRLHLVAPCSPEEFATRHVLESLMTVRHLPQGARLVDVGSGGGLPVIPCLIAREDLSATLIESSQKKGVFLSEALRTGGASARARLIVARFEQTDAPAADFVTCRALDRFPDLLPTLIAWAPPAGTLLLFAGAKLKQQIEALLPSAKAESIPQSERRFLIIASLPFS